MVHPRIYCCVFKPSVVALYRVLTPELWHFSFLTWERFFFLIAFNSFLKTSQVFHRICWCLKLSAAIARSVVGPSPSHDFQVRACFREPLKVAAAYFAWILPLCSSARVGCQVMFFSVSLSTAHESTDVLIPISGPMAPQSAHFPLRPWPAGTSDRVAPALPREL